MTELRFDGQVAIVTGAGGSPSLGRSHAHPLAERERFTPLAELGILPDDGAIVPKPYRPA